MESLPKVFGTMPYIPGMFHIGKFFHCKVETLLLVFLNSKYTNATGHVYRSRKPKPKTENHLGYPEARRLVEGATPSPGAKTYAAVSRVSTRTVDCQTDITWLSRERPLAMISGKSQTPVSTKAQIHHSPSPSNKCAYEHPTTDCSESESQCPARQASARGRCRRVAEPLSHSLPE